MMRYYYVKQNLFGVPKGTVERFADANAGPLLHAGSIEPVDDRKRHHAEAPGIDAVPVDQRRPPAKCPSCGAKDASR